MIICFCYVIRGSLYIFPGVSHGNADSRQLQHADVVISVPSGHDLLRADPQQRSKFHQTCAFIYTGRINLNVVSKG